MFWTDRRADVVVDSPGAGSGEAASAGHDQPGAGLGPAPWEADARAGSAGAGGERTDPWGRTSAQSAGTMETVAAAPAPAATPAAQQPDQVAVDEEFLSAMAAEFDAIEASLVRLEDGTFDTCQVCGGRIGQDRLIADPLITRCPDHS